MDGIHFKSHLYITYSLQLVGLNIVSKIVCKKSHLQIEGFLFGSWRYVTGEQEVNLRLYLCKPIYQIKDFVQVCVFRISDDFNYNYKGQVSPFKLQKKQYITVTEITIHFALLPLS